MQMKRYSQTVLDQAIDLAFELGRSARGRLTEAKRRDIEIAAAMLAGQPADLSSAAKALLREASGRLGGWPVDYVDADTRENLEGLRSLGMIAVEWVAGDMIYRVTDRTWQRIAEGDLIIRADA